MEDKDINNLKEIVDLCEKEIKNNNYNATAILDMTDLKSLNNLLNELERLQKYNEKLKQCANWHIEHLTETILDYIDDDRVGNADYIGELKEQREHWRDVLRIINNEKTYINYNDYLG